MQLVSSLLALLALSVPLSAQWYLAQPTCTEGARAAFINLGVKPIPLLIITATKSGALLGILVNVPTVRAAGPKGVIFRWCPAGGITWTTMTVAGEKPVRFYTRSIA